MTEAASGNIAWRLPGFAWHLQAYDVVSVILLYTTSETDPPRSIIKGQKQVYNRSSVKTSPPNLYSAIEIRDISFGCTWIFPGVN